MSEPSNDSGMGCVVLMIMAFIILTNWLASNAVGTLRWELRNAQHRIAILEQRCGE